MTGRRPVWPALLVLAAAITRRAVVAGADAAAAGGLPPQCGGACGPRQQCRLVAHSCIGTACSVTPRCVSSAQQSGGRRQRYMCPQSQLTAACNTQSPCTSDHQCHPEWRCCDRGCGSACVPVCQRGCGEGEQCQLVEVRCIGSHCPEVAQCVAAVLAHTAFAGLSADAKFLTARKASEMADTFTTALRRRLTTTTLQQQRPLSVASRAIVPQVTTRIRVSTTRPHLRITTRSSSSSSPHPTPARMPTTTSWLPFAAFTRTIRTRPTTRTISRLPSTTTKHPSLTATTAATAVLLFGASVRVSRPSPRLTSKPPHAANATARTQHAPAGPVSSAGRISSSRTQPVASAYKSGHCPVNDKASNVCFHEAVPEACSADADCVGSRRCCLRGCRRRCALVCAGCGPSQQCRLTSSHGTWPLCV